MPLIDSINGQEFSIDPQGGGDHDGFARGAWDWSMLWKRIPLGDREKALRHTQTEPYRYTTESTEDNHVQSLSGPVLFDMFGRKSGVSQNRQLS